MIEQHKEENSNQKEHDFSFVGALALDNKG
jgi:hypothetical protein